MTTIIKHGTIVTADLTYEADVQQSIRARPMVGEPSLARRTTHPTGFHKSAVMVGVAE